MRKSPTLTEAQRQARRDNINRIKPWERASGPQTVEGKEASAKRAQKHGLRSAEAIAAQQWVSSVRGLLKTLAKRKTLYAVIVMAAVLMPSNLSQYF
jgi:hypothetical protein